MKLCAHLGFQFTEYAGLERLTQAARAGFEAVEWPAIYGFDAQELATRLRDLGLQWVQVTLPTGDHAKGDKGLASLPDRIDEFRSGVLQAIEYAKALGSKLLHPMAGIGVLLDDPAAMQTYLSNLEFTLEQARAHDLTVLIEVISSASVPGYAMCRYDLAETVCTALPEIKILIDAYHAQTLTQDPASVVHRWAGRIAHVQIADSPGRNEPGTGQLDFPTFFTALKRAGYEGWLGCEYKPLAHTLDGLPRLDNLRQYL